MYAGLYVLACVKFTETVGRTLQTRVLGSANRKHRYMVCHLWYVCGVSVCLSDVCMYVCVLCIFCVCSMCGVHVCVCGVHVVCMVYMYVSH